MRLLYSVFDRSEILKVVSLRGIGAYALNFVCYVFFSSVPWIHAREVKSDVLLNDVSIQIDPNNGMVKRLKLINGKSDWAFRPFVVFESGATGEIEASLELVQSENSTNIRARLHLRNAEDLPVSITPVFPILDVAGDDSNQHKNLRYCFPSRTPNIDTVNISERGWYSGIYPVRYFSVDHAERGVLYAIVDGGENEKMLFGLDKTDDYLRLFTQFEERELKAGEDWASPWVELGLVKGDWRDVHEVYKRKMKITNPAPRGDLPWFREVFNFRVQYLYQGPPMGDAVFDGVNKHWTVNESLERDRQAFGGADFLHLFDWSQTPNSGRVGNYEPWEHLGGIESFLSMVKQVEAKGIPIGLYTEGYLAEKTSKPGLEFGEEAGMLDAEGKPINSWGDQYVTMCPYHPAWKAYLSKTFARLKNQTGAIALYVDQLGFGTQYRCFHPGHAKFHRQGAESRLGEIGLVKKLRESVGANVALYVEETPMDILMPWLDGAYTASIHMGVQKGIDCPINLTRFTFPQFKIFELISESGLQDNLKAVELSFFSGQGLYLSGRPENAYSEKCLALIRKTHDLLRKYRDAFTSEDCQPLVTTLSSNVCANRFACESTKVWTLYNRSSENFSGKVLSVPHVENSIYMDAWSGQQLYPEVEGGYAIISLEISALSSGCIVQKLR
jgi:hypothetical protein